VRPTRQTQPYRKGAREPGAALTAMTRGRTASGYHPKDVEREMLVQAGRKTRKKRPDRPARPPRPVRPPR
jgi:hypothetical protein